MSHTYQMPFFRGHSALMHLDPCSYHICKVAKVVSSIELIIVSTLLGIFTITCGVLANYQSNINWVREPEGAIILAGIVTCAISMINVLLVLLGVNAQNKYYMVPYIILQVNH